MGKHALRFLLLSYPAPPANPSLGMTPTVKLYSVALTDYILKSVSYQKKDWWDPVRQSFFWYDNDKDLKAHFPMIQLKYLWALYYINMPCID